ncbi:MAG: hypothetical protein J0I07_13900 [Myxococcales bacterium]|nr:hypothetical protein [Myxococcales bacterium]
MTEPRRLLDEASGLDRAVLESAADDAPSPARRRRVVAALGLTSVAVSSSAAAAGGVASWKIAIGIAAVTSLGVGGAIVRAQHSPADEPRTVPVVVATARPVPSASAMPSAAPIAPIVSAAPMPQVEAPPSPVVVTARPAPRRMVRETAEIASDATPSIAREIALIDRARASIAKGAPKSALATLDEYDVTCPAGTLSLEASVLRIEALAAAGHHDSAAARARSFLERHPRSTYDARVRAHLTNR